MTQRPALHETFGRDAPARPLERSFGLVFASVALFVGLLPLRNGEPLREGWLAASALLLVLALTAPGVLRVPNELWFRFGMVLHRIVSPVVLMLIFAVVITPLALVLRAIGHDALHRRREPGAASYLELRPTPPVNSMRDQF